MASQPTVFIVDDDPAMRDSLTWLLQAVGLAVETHVSAEEFLEAYDPTRPGCLVLDMRLPGMSGLALQDVLAARGIKVPLIIITGYAQAGTKARVLKGGALDFIEKPFSDEVLVSRIRQALEADRQARGVTPKS